MIHVDDVTKSALYDNIDNVELMKPFCIAGFAISTKLDSYVINFIF